MEQALFYYIATVSLELDCWKSMTHGISFYIYAKNNIQ